MRAVLAALGRGVRLVGDDTTDVEAARRQLTNVPRCAGPQEYKVAAKGFEEVDRHIPTSVWAPKRRSWRLRLLPVEKDDDAIIALDRLSRSIPATGDIPTLLSEGAVLTYERYRDGRRDQRTSPSSARCAGRSRQALNRIALSCDAR